MGSCDLYECDCSIVFCVCNYIVLKLLGNCFRFVCQDLFYFKDYLFVVYVRQKCEVELNLYQFILVCVENDVDEDYGLCQKGDIYIQL